MDYGCKKIMEIGLLDIQLRRDKRLYENKEWNTRLGTANLRILLDLTTFLQGHFTGTLSLLSSLCPLTKPSGAIYKENFYRNIYYSEYNDLSRECRGRLHVDIWLKKQSSEAVEQEHGRGLECNSGRLGG